MEQLDRERNRPSDLGPVQPLTEENKAKVDAFSKMTKGRVDGVAVREDHEQRLNAELERVKNAKAAMDAAFGAALKARDHLQELEEKH